MPFEFAYNWNLAIRSVLTGLGMFMLLRRLRVGAYQSVILALTYQFGGWFTFYFGHPWIQGSFVYFPFLWVAWLAAEQHSIGWRDGISALLVALIFSSGNLQSHTYLPLFAFAYCLGSMWYQKKLGTTALRVVVLSGLLGGLLAMPLLVNQIEFYLVGIRSISKDLYGWKNLLAIPQTFVSIHPWAMGTFRTFDLGRLFDSNGGAYRIFCGGAASIACLIGVFLYRKNRAIRSREVFTSLVLITIYIIVVSSPLNGILYPRLAALAGIGIIVIAGSFLRDLPLLRDGICSKAIRRIAFIFGLGVIASSVIFLLAYPHVKEKIEQKVNQIGVKNSGGLGTPELRQVQIDRLRQEVTLLNPLAVVGFAASLTCLVALALTRSTRWHGPLLKTSLALGLTVTYCYHWQFRPMHDVSLWEKMKHGGPQQQKILALAAGEKRVDETLLLGDQQAFPLAWAAWYRVHVVQGYSALQPYSILWRPPELSALPAGIRADLSLTAQGEIIVSNSAGGARFYAKDAHALGKITSISHGHNAINLRMPPSVHEVENFVSTDSFYPGWRESKSGARPQNYDYSFSLWQVPTSADGKLSLVYEPTYLRLGKYLFFFSACGVLFLVWISFLPRGACLSARNA